MQIAVKVTIDAPPAVVFRFFKMLDHLRYVGSSARYEWCAIPGTVVEPGKESEVRIQQGRHRITVRFKTLRLETDRLIEDEFLSWPLKGARHVQALEPQNGGSATKVANITTWEPPWYLRVMIERYESQQRQFFIERQHNAKRLIEAVYRARGDQAFSDGILDDVTLIGASPQPADDIHT